MNNESQSNQKITRYLQSNGFLFHGSAISGLSTLEPRQANDSDDSNIWNKDTAVFASDDPVSAIAFAIIRKIQATNGHMNWEFYWKDNGDRVAVLSEQLLPYLSDTTASLYVVKTDTFKQHDNGSQFKSAQPVDVIEEIEVTWSDFLQLGGIQKAL